MSAAILNDLTLCVGCGSCVQACREANGLPQSPPDAPLSGTRWSRLAVVDGLGVRRQCMHCVDPACVSVCPVGALKKTAAGPVTYDPDACIGCRYCMVACPFDVPRYTWSSRTPRITKCTMCSERIAQGATQPACTAACPTGATEFGERDALLAKAHLRLREHPDRYVDHVYGETEAGGTQVLYLSPVSFEALGFQTELRHAPYPELTWYALSKLPPVVSATGVGLAGLWWIIHRRDKLATERRSASRDPEVGHA